MTKDHIDISGDGSYFCAYLEVHRIKNGDEVKFSDYLHWITNKHNEFRRIRSYSFYNSYPPDVQKEFKAFLRKGVFVETQKKFPRSPLRYPGGKNRAIKAICAHIPSNETKLCSPFLGGASIELACTPKMQVYGYDVFSPLIDFWQVLIDDHNLLADKVEHYYPLSKDNFYNLQKRYVNLENKIERAAAFYALNRSSFSGTTLSGGMSPGHPRFTKSSIERLRSFRVDNFHVECADFREVLPKHKDAFLYLDPPYINGQALYGVKGDTHKSFNHQALADILHKRDRWVMSYNDRNEIRELYKDNPILSVEWIYGMSKNKQSSEILVLSKDLAAV